jgi:carbamoyl-phosphate synthase large subunit
VANRDKRSIIMAVKKLSDLGFEILSTGGTAAVLNRNGISATVVRKVSDGGEGTIVDLINDGKVDMVFNTPSGGAARGDGYEIRAAATSVGKPCITTVAEFNFAVLAIEAMRSFEWDVTSLQEHAASVRGASAAPAELAAEPARA